MQVPASAGFEGKVAFIWSVADLLRGDKQSEYGKVILPLGHSAPARLLAQADQGQGARSQSRAADVTRSPRPHRP